VAGPPLDDISGKWKDDDKVSAGRKAGGRRTPLEEAQKAITEHLSGAADKTGAGSFCSPACSIPSMLNAPRF
jgi:hypothetical protein